MKPLKDGYSRTMLAVPLEQQWQLLKLAEMDNQLNRLRLQLHAHPAHEQLARAEAALARCVEACDRQARHAQELQAQLSSLEERTNSVSAHIQEKEAKQHAGVGLTSRDLLTLQKEIDTLAANRDELENEQLEVMIELEGAQEQLKNYQEQREIAKAHAAQCAHERTAAVDAVKAEGIALRQERDALAAQLDSAMISRYENLRAHGSIAVVSMQPSGMLSSGESLGAVEIAQLKALADDVLFEDDERDVLIVRLFSAAQSQE